MEVDDISTHIQIQVQLTEGSFKNKDGEVIFTRLWTNKDQTPKALIFVTHGFAEHSARYGDFLVPALVNEGFLVISHDHVGHGKSEGERVQIHDFHAYVRDIFHNIDQVAAKHPSLSVFLFGHSMGGAIAIITAMERPTFFTGVVLSGPAIISDKDTTCLRCLGKMVAFIAPSVQVIPAIDPAATCRDPEKIYEGYYHELLNEPRQYSNIVRRDIIEWLRKRMPASGS
ncbi:hypothetical protein QZH41_017925 [Actinostola sp. cb2023]|nr:hypothetical protein QZH41_017925 [Actinostola sp. cb2023]